jgi:bifunctional UDP-N-acetylglucosamine pyrophosphorylase / glucosamine-1-phosphate N-acetyltransferase
MRDIHVVILAAGEGKRMHSAIPKVLHTLAGVPLLERIVNTAQSLVPNTIHVVYGYKGDEVKARLSHLPIHWVEQQKQLGTGHAVLQVLPSIPDDTQVVVMFGDVPLISSETLKQLLLSAQKLDGLVIMTAMFDNPTGLGRIIRNKEGAIQRIVEERDASPAERSIHEINSGILSAKASFLKRLLTHVTTHNSQGEYYLTDIVSFAVKESLSVETISAPAIEVQGVNDHMQLAMLERSYQKMIAEKIMLEGVTLIDPARFDLRGNAIFGSDVVIDINVILEGQIQIGSNVVIGPNCYLKNVSIGNNVTIKANSVVEDAVIADQCSIGPFARLRPGSELGVGVRIGNFVELKNAKLGSHTTAGHLSYLGDVTIGHEVTIGAGTITCNYDGINKHQTQIGDRAFVGSGTELVAPVTIGSDATIGAGSTITKNAPPEALTLGRAKQTTIVGWQRRSKDKA